MTALSPDEKREVAGKFLALKDAITASAPDLDAIYHSFRSAYRGAHTAYIEKFHSAQDKALWAGQLDMYLSEEIEPQFWPHR